MRLRRAVITKYNPSILFTLCKQLMCSGLLAGVMDSTARLVSSWYNKSTKSEYILAMRHKSHFKGGGIIYKTTLLSSCNWPKLHRADFLFEVPILNLHYQKMHLFLLLTTVLRKSGLL